MSPPPIYRYTRLIDWCISPSLSYLNDSKDTTPFMYCIFQVLYFCFTEHICPFIYLLNYLNSHQVFCFLQVLCSPLCTVPLLCFTRTTRLVLVAVFLRPSGYLWWSQAEMTHKAIIIIIKSCSILRFPKSGCDGCLMSSPPQISLMFEETLTFTWCALKWKGTSLLQLLYVHDALFMVVFFHWQLLNHTFHLKYVWIDILVFISVGSRFSYIFNWPGLLFFTPNVI